MFLFLFFPCCYDMRCLLSNCNSNTSVHVRSSRDTEPVTTFQISYAVTKSNSHYLPWEEQKERAREKGSECGPCVRSRFVLVLLLHNEWVWRIFGIRRARTGCTLHIQRVLQREWAQWIKATVRERWNYWVATPTATAIATAFQSAWTEWKQWISKQAVEVVKKIMHTTKNKIAWESGIFSIRRAWEHRCTDFPGLNECIARFA